MHNEFTSSATASGFNESYLYDETGRRVRKVSNGVITFYPTADYWQTGSVVGKHYGFAGQIVAERDNAGVAYLYHDRVGSTIHVTNQTGGYWASRGYYAYGETRRSDGTMPTDRRFTSQQESATGLYYYGARWYDPTIGQFVSPDTIVPDASNFLDYNRYLYARGNPLKYNDPTGHYSVDELMQHFGVSSFKELMKLFEEGGSYAGLEGWYDVLRAAQDGDTVIATNEVAGVSLTGKFVRSAQGNIQIDRGEWGITSESVFAQFGGIVTQGKAGQEYITGIGTYELRGQESLWRNAVTGGQRRQDMTSCYNIDCVAATIDAVGVAGSVLQVASPACLDLAVACSFVGRGLSGGATMLGMGWTSYNAWRGNATSADLAATVTTGAVGTLTKDPRVGLGAAIAQSIWDTMVSPQQR